MTSEADVQALVAAAESRLGGIDVMMNNAGLGGSARLVDMTDDQWFAVLGVTLDGTMRCVRAALRHMIARGAGGAIVNNASVSGWRAQREQAHYAAAKAGVMALTRCAALEAADHGVRVNCVAPSLAWHPHLAKTSSEALLSDLARREAFGRAAEPWEGGQRDGVPGQRPVRLHDRRGRLGEQPASLTARAPRGAAAVLCGLGLSGDPSPGGGVAVSPRIGGTRRRG